MARLKVALLGGSFDPVHEGHRLMACSLVKKRGFDEVWFLPAKQAPLKRQHEVSFEDRFAMIELLIHKHPRIKACTIENQLPLPSYTIDTISALKKQYEHDFALVIGADQAAQFDSWKDHERLLKLVEVIVIQRKGYNSNDSRFSTLPAVSLTSSTDIRNGISNDTHPDVLRYMIYHHLYDRSILSHHINPSRLEHCLSVTNTALMISKNLDVDPNWLIVASMYHDIAKDWAHDKTIEWLERDGIDYQELPHYQLHAVAAASFMKHFYYIDHPYTLDAIIHHVSGTSEQLLSKILFVADKIEPTRDYDTSSLITLACEDLDHAFKLVKEENKAYNQKEGGML